MTHRALALLPFLLSSLVVGCLPSSHEAGDGGVPPEDGSAPVDGGDGHTCTSLLKQSSTTKVDLLFVVDDSPSMVEEQASLATEIPRLVHTLTTGDRDGDGVRDFLPVGDLHAGAITVNMGVGGVPNVPTCMTRPDFGDDGVLLSMPRTSDPGCMPSYPMYETFTPSSDAAQFSTDLSCVARTGAMGCGFEQQLDAMLKAVVPSTSPIRFAEGTHGHGDEANAGFLRPDSLLVVVLVTDEDDCSTSESDIWNPLSSTHTGDLNLRCVDYAGELYPITRFVDGLRSLRPENPNGIVFAALTGVPADLAAAPSMDYDALFADPRMMNHVDTSSGTSLLEPACSTPGRGSAAPAIRIAKVAQAFGQNGVLASICAADYGPAFDTILTRVTNALGNVCLPSALPRDTDGAVGCHLHETFVPSGSLATCADVPGSVSTGPSADGLVHCDVPQLPVDAATRASGVAPSGTGWYFDDYTTATHDVCSSAGSRVAFTTDATPPPGVEVRLECASDSCF